MVELPDFVQEAIDNEIANTRSYRFSDLSSVTKFRVTGIQSAENCGRYWRESFLTLPMLGDTPLQESGNVYTQTGTLIHLLLENSLLPFAGKAKKLSASDEKLIHEKLEELGETKTLFNCQTYRGRLFDLMMEGYEILEIEKKVQVPNKYINLSGHVDVVMKNPAGGITVLDHKTNRKPASNAKWQSKFQMNAYGNALCEEHGVDKIEFIIGNVNLAEDNKFPICRNEFALNIRIHEALENIRKNTEGVGDDCYSCSSKESCNAHKRAYGDKPLLPFG